MLKHSLYAVAAAAALSATSAYAQQESNVRVYGRINLSFENQKTDSHVNVLQDNASRWGLIGEEAIAPGMSAIFNLESGFGADNGVNKTANSSFDRESWVGLRSTSLGQLRLGATTSPVYYAAADYVSMHNHDTGTSSDAFFGFEATGGHLKNMTAYKTPVFWNSTVEVAYAMAEDTRATSTTNVAYNYEGDALHVGAGYAQSKVKGLSNSKNTMYVVRALYDFTKNFVAGGYYEYDKYDVEGRRNNFRLAAMYTLGASEFHLNYGYTPGFRNIDKSRAQQFTVAYNYNLSKRTKVYAFYTLVDNSKGASYMVATPGENFSSIAVGMRHNF